jgi:hypothetical protein
MGDNAKADAALNRLNALFIVQHYRVLVVWLYVNFLVPPAFFSPMAPMTATMIHLQSSTANHLISKYYLYLLYSLNLGTNPTYVRTRVLSTTLVKLKTKGKARTDATPSATPP